MTWQLVLILSLALVFYGSLPAIGAFMARGQWRRFRSMVTEVSHYPTATPAAVGRERGGPLGAYRFFGTLEAIQGNDRIWITNGRFSVGADLRNVRVSLIPETEGGASDSWTTGGRAGAALGSVPWSRIFSLPEGTPVFLGGRLFAEEGRAIFRHRSKLPLLVVIHDCPRERVVLRAISGGRQRNEIVNSFTLPSVGVGSLSLLLFAFSLLALPDRLLAIIALMAAVAPASPFLPPAFPLYFAYRSYWKKARMLRVQRDVISLPLRYFPAGNEQKERGTLLPDMEPYLMIRGKWDAHDGTLATGEKTRIPLPPEIDRVEVALPPRWRKRAAAALEHDVVFCGYSVENDRVHLRRPEDPMADALLVPGDPQAIAEASSRAARFYELVSVGFIAMNVAINLPLIFLLLSRLVR
jgi:hypothetical protein